MNKAIYVTALLYAMFGWVPLVIIDDKLNCGLPVGFKVVHWPLRFYKASLLFVAGYLIWGSP